MKTIFQISLFASLSLLLFSSCGNTVPYHFPHIHKIKLGDSIEWAEKNFDDNEWEWEIDDDTHKGIFWVRLHTVLPEPAKPFQKQAIKIIATGAYEAYWDGVYLGRNGQLKTETQAEIHGKYQSFFLLPDSLQTSGKHVLSMRTTKVSPYPGQHARFIIQNYIDLLRAPLQISKYMFMIAGGFLITAIYFFFVYAGKPKEYAVLIFGIICLLFFGLLLMEYLKFFYNYDYPFQKTRMEIIGMFHIALCVLTPLFFMIQFSFPWKKYLMGIITLTVLILQLKYHSSFDWVASIYDQLLWLFSTLTVIYACYEKKKGAYIVLTALFIGLPIVYIMRFIDIPFVSIYDISIFIVFFIIMLSMLYVMTLKNRAEQKAYEASLILSERLKNELLKKNIKPHFIMNTLTSLIDWVEESPKEGVKFITALAGEFEVLNQIADYKQVPIGQEIKLCKRHLEVMGYRKEISYKWEEQGIDPNDIIPPAIIHTIVENGVTHSLPDKNGQITFRLVFEKNKVFKKYTLSTIAQNRNEPSPDNIKNVEGTGLKYIKARLQESYADNWKIKSNETSEGWETSIKITAI